MISVLFISLIITENNSTETEINHAIVNKTVVTVRLEELYKYKNLTVLCILSVVPVWSWTEIPVFCSNVVSRCSFSLLTLFYPVPEPLMKHTINHYLSSYQIFSLLFLLPEFWVFSVWNLHTRESVVVYNMSYKPTTAWSHQVSPFQCPFLWCVFERVHFTSEGCRSVHLKMKSLNPFKCGLYIWRWDRFMSLKKKEKRGDVNFTWSFGSIIRQMLLISFPFAVYQ